MLDETQTETPSIADEEKPLPEGWLFVRLGDVCTLQRGFDLPRQNWIDGNYPIVGSNGIIGFHNEFTAKAPGVVTGRSGTIGKVHYIDSDYFPHNTSLYVKDFKGNYPKFVKYLLESIDLKSLGEQTTAVPSLDRKNAHKVKVTLPPTVEEQKRIASILDEQMKAVEEARRAVKEQLEAASLLPSAFLRSVFESEEAKKWQKRKLGEITNRISKGESPNWQGFDYTNEGAFFIRSENVHWGRLSKKPQTFIPLEFHEKLSRSKLRSGDVLINLVGASIGRACVVPEDIGEANINQAVGVVTPNADVLDADYLVSFVISDETQKHFQEVQVEFARPNISLDNLRTLIVPAPSIEEQRKIAERLSEQMQAVETLKQSLTEKLEAVKKLPVALLRKAFAGEI